MKKLLIVLTVLGLMLPISTAFAQAQDNELLVVFGSDPKEITNEAGDFYLDVEVGDEITFTRKVVSIGMASFDFVWNYDPAVLDCSPQPNPDSSTLVCTALAEGASAVSYTANAIMDDQSEMTADSKVITVYVYESLPEMNISDYAGHKNETAIQYLYDEGIVEGYPDGTFKPDNNLTRAELMKILVLGAGYDPNAETYSNCFPDVGDDWFARYVCFAKEQGWVEGYEDGTFKPGNNVLKVEAIKMLLEIFNVRLNYFPESPFEDVGLDQWYSTYVITAAELNLLEETGLYNPGDLITRGGVSENIYRLIIDEQQRFDAANKEMLCDLFDAGEFSLDLDINEDLAPLLKEKLIYHGFDSEEEGAFEAITSRNSYTITPFLNDPETYCAA